MNTENDVKTVPEFTTTFGEDITDIPVKAQAPIMKYFEYDHLPEKLQKVSRPICLMAQEMENTLPNSAEKSAGLRKLLEAKDCLCRAAL